MLWAPLPLKKSVGPAGDHNSGPTLLGQKSLGPAGGRFPLLFAPDGFGAKVPGPCRRAIPPAPLPSIISVQKTRAAGGQASDPR